MNSFKVCCFLVILLLSLAYCSNLNGSNVIETGSPLRLRRLSENVSENDFSDGESNDLITNQSIPRIILNQYRASLNVNISIYLISELSSKYNNNFKNFLTFTLFLNIICYFKSRFYISRSNSPPDSISHWSIAPLSWITEIIILLPPEKYSYLSDNFFLPHDKSVLYFSFFLQMAYYLSGFSNLRNIHSIDRN